MIDKTVNYLQSIELLKKIETIAERMGLAYDDVLIYAAHPVLPCWVLGQQATKTDHYFASEDIYTYTSSSLELLLPEWCLEVYEAQDSDLIDLVYTKHGIPNLYNNKGITIWGEMYAISLSRGKQKVEALARLIILLDENDLLKGKQ